VEWWERIQAAWIGWLAGSPRRRRSLLILNLVAAALAVVAAVTVDGFGRGAHVWLPCVGMLLGWLAISPTKTIRWSSVLRLFTLSALWSAAIALISERVVAGTGLRVQSAGPSIGVAAVVEETLKLAPLALLAVLAPGRVRRFAAVDWLLAGLACGMGFQAAEDFARQAIPSAPSLLDVLNGVPARPYGFTLFGGSSTIPGGATYAGHHIETALIAAGIGLAVCGARRGIRLALWLLPLFLWLVTVADHAGFNATNQDQRTFTSGHSTVPSLLFTTWRWTGRGANRGWLLITVLVVSLLVDGRRQSSEEPSSRPVPGTSQLATPNTTVLWPERAAAAFASGVTGLASVVARSVRAAGVPWRVPDQSLRGALAGTFAALAAERRRRETQCPPVRPQPPWWTTRLAAGVVGSAGTIGAILGAQSLARTIGSTLTPSRTWFAGLLDAFGSWWDGLGPGGQGMVVLGGLGLVVLGAGLLLAPEIVIPALVTEGGAIIPGLVIDGGAVALPSLVAGTGLLAMAGAGAAGSGSGPSGSGSEGGGSGSEPPESGPSPEVQARLDELARDPAHNGKITAGSMEEARIGYDLEQSGRLEQGIYRDPSGRAEFIEPQSGQPWDVKSFNSNFPVRKGGFEIVRATSAVAKELTAGENVIVNTTNMSSQAVADLQAVVAENGWVGRVIFWP
jgi:RsiW-degrading membrane proteinase PrsW (M82 family)